MDAPPGRRVPAIVAISAGQAADSADAVANRCSRGRKIQHSDCSAHCPQAIWTRQHPLPHKHDDARQQASVPRESGLEPMQKAHHDLSHMTDSGQKDLVHCHLQLGGIFQLVPQFGPDDTNDHDHCDYIQSVSINAVALERAMQHSGSGNGREPKQQAKGPKVHCTDIYIRIHNPHTPRVPIGTQRKLKPKYIAAPGSPTHRRAKRGNLQVMLKSSPALTFPPSETMDVLFTQLQIAERVREIGAQISSEYAGQSIVLIGVLKGAAIFLADLARAITVDNTFDFVAVSSYGRARVSSGAVKLIKDIDNPIEGKHVILVEDILDTGLTLSYLRGLMLQHKPASLKIATCLDKPERRLVPIEADYIAFKIPNQFVIGYGMDYAEIYRNLPDIRLFPEELAGH